MPTVTRARSVAARPEDVWRVVSDPHRLPAWWPGVARVEEASPEAWTKVLTSARGKTVRADFTRLEAEPPTRIVWRQEVEETPFERLLDESRTEIELAEEDQGTRVELSIHQRPRGWARFGSFQLRAATTKQVEDALSGLAQMLEAQA